MDKYGDIGRNLDDNIDQIIADYDETFMPVPDIEFEPQTLISKVRKHYMEYMIRLLSTNYETNQKLLNKNIYLPSAIWRCAKNIEMKAAQTCMVVQLYRNYIVSVIKEVKKDTLKGRLNTKLFECLHKPPLNEKRTQTLQNDKNDIVNCQCNTNDIKRRRKKSIPNNNKSFNIQVEEQLSEPIGLQNHNIPVLINMQIDDHIPPKHEENQPKAIATIPKTDETDSDELMMQLEKLFQTDDNIEDIFESTMLDNVDTPTDVNTNKTLQKPVEVAQLSVIQTHDAQIKSLDERLASLSEMLVNIEPSQVQQTKVVQQKKRRYASKWICEEYYTKRDLYDLLYQIGDGNRKKLSRIKHLYIQLFGEDSDDEEEIVSPISESSQFVESCKTRISSWVVTSLNPYYARGRIRGKALYKSVAKHLIDLIYKCKQYPSETEVTSFVLDFLENHEMIRCEADFKEFRINNVQTSFNLIC